MQGEDAGPAGRVAEMIGFESSAFRPGFWRGFRAGVLCALAAAGFVALLVRSAPARAEPIATARDETGSITLHDEPGICPGRALLAVWQSADKSRAVLGCWLLASDGYVRIAYFDGDVGRLRGAAFWWLV